MPQWTWQLPPGGLSLWVDLGEPIASPLAERALDYGVRIEGGAYFATDPGIFEQRLRIPYTTSPDTLREAVRRMATALADSRIGSPDGIPAGFCANGSSFQRPGSTEGLRRGAVTESEPEPSQALAQLLWC
ncbi:hypothetical protein [Streptomyces sp. NPDC005125]